MDGTRFFGVVLPGGRFDLVFMEGYFTENTSSLSI
jgi:hypothetical protein